MSFQVMYGALWNRIEQIAIEAYSIEGASPAFAEDLCNAVLSWGDRERHRFVPLDSWNTLCLVPATFLLQALADPKGVAGRLLAHAQPALGFVETLPQGFETLPTDAVRALESLGLRYKSLKCAKSLAGSVWLASGSVWARDAWCNHSEPIHGLWRYWVTVQCWIPTSGLHPEVVDTVLDLVTAYAEGHSKGTYTADSCPNPKKNADLRIALAFAVLGAKDSGTIPGMKADCFSQTWQAFIRSLTDAPTAHAQIRAAELRATLLDARDILLLPHPPKTIDDILKKPI